MIKDRSRILNELELIYNIDRECFEVLTTKQAIYLYYRTEHSEINFFTFEQLGNAFSVSRQAVEQALSRGLKTLSKQPCFQKRRRK